MAGGAVAKGSWCETRTGTRHSGDVIRLVSTTGVSKFGTVTDEAAIAWHELQWSRQVHGPFSWAGFDSSWLADAAA